MTKIVTELTNGDKILNAVDNQPEGNGYVDANYVPPAPPSTEESLAKIATATGTIAAIVTITFIVQVLAGLYLGTQLS